MKATMKIFCGCSIFAIIAVAGIANAATTARPTLANTSANRTPSTGARMPTATNNTQSTTTVETTTAQPGTTVTAPEPEPERVIIVDNKTSMFNDVLADMGANASDSSSAELAATIARQRALLDAQSEKSTNDATGSSGITTANVCDAGLRKCMAEKCGSDFTKCASDSTTVWGNKMDACRRQTKCTGHEYTMLAPEILADRDTGIELAYYQSVVNCGNRYNDCMFGICGKTLDKCLSKTAGDSAIAKCKSIADECREQDSGLAGRISGVFGDLRTAATTQAQKDEKRLYELRDLMRNQCQRFGAMFDERTLDCVYTVNFFVDKISTDNPVASKKLYSGDAFQCTPNWFGIDITTYIENAQRLTRSQTSASAAAMGAGLGTAAGLWTSGAVTRGIDTQNAEAQAKEACESAGGEWVSAGFNKGKKCDMRKPKEDCEKSGHTWDDETGCTSGNNTGTNNNGGNNSTPTGNKPYDTLNKTLNDYNVLDNIDKEKYCNMFSTNDCPPEYCVIRGNKCIAKTDSSTGGGRNPTDISDFKRPDAKGEEPTDKQLEDDKTGRICRRYYTDDWCTEYYNLYNKEKEANKAATKEQRQKRREEISNKLKTGFSNVTTKIGDIFKKDNDSENCESFCTKQAKKINRTQLFTQISTIDNPTCYNQCDTAFTQQCQIIFGSNTSKFTKQCDEKQNPRACVYNCEYVKSNTPHPAS